MSTLQDLKDSLSSARDSVEAAQVSASQIQDPLNALISKLTAPVSDIDYGDQVRMADEIKSRAISVKGVCDQFLAQITVAIG
jgi:hypothetical protein